MQMSRAPTTLPEQKQELPSLVYSSHNSLQLCEGTLNLQTHNLGKAQEGRREGTVQVSIDSS